MLGNGSGGFSLRKSSPTVVPATFRSFASVLLSKATRPPSLVFHHSANEFERFRTSSLNREIVAKYGTRNGPSGDQHFKSSAVSRAARRSEKEPNGNQNVSTVTTHDSLSSDGTQPCFRQAKAKVTTRVKGTPTDYVPQGEARRKKSKRSGKLNRSGYSSGPTPETSFSSTDSPPKRFGQAAVLPLADCLSPCVNEQKSLLSGTMSKKLQPINEDKSLKTKKPSENPKHKRPSRLKRIILNERLRRSVSAPDNLNLSQNEAEKPSDSPAASLIMTEARISEVVRNVRRSPLSKDQERKVAEFLSRLSTFQDNAHAKYINAPFHQRRTRRLVCGLREVVKHLKLKHLSFLFLARDLEGNATDKCYALKDSAVSKIQEGSTVESNSTVPVLEGILQHIWTLATDTDPVTPIIVAQTRRALGRLCHKPGRVSVVGILSISGAEELSKELLSMNLAINVQTAGADEPTTGQGGHRRMGRKTSDVTFQCVQNPEY